jgi:hypothetical protein
MQEAIALSMGQPPPGQQTGVTGKGQQSGIAQGDYRNTEHWAMTVSKASAREVAENPPPAYRQRRQGEPAFLRASDGFGSQDLAALLTIYHSIPLAREALLFPSYQHSNYGYDEQWWTGKCIEVSKTDSLDDGEAARNHDDLVVETQRLMAFLDGTHRAYASIDALAELRAYPKEAESEVTWYLQGWRDSVCFRNPDDHLTQVFTSRGVRNDPTGVIDRHFCSLEPEVDPDASQTFTDVLDKIIWSDQRLDVPVNDIYIDSVADILTLRLSDPKRKQGNLGVEIPAVWYADRYMAHFRAASREMRIRRQNLLKGLWNLERSRSQILRCTPSNRQGLLDVRKVLSEAAARTPVAVKSQVRQDITDTGLPRTPSADEVNQCVKAMQNILASIDAKLMAWENERNQLLVEVRATADELTRPVEGSSLSPVHKYTLRGISTRQNVTYIQQPVSEEDIGTSAESSVTDQCQWWRISASGKDTKLDPPAARGTCSKPSQSKETSSHDPRGPYPQWASAGSQNNELDSLSQGNFITYQVRKACEEEVLRSAREEDDPITLVYASDKAVSFQGTNLSEPLRAFVKADNDNFDKELRATDDSQVMEVRGNGDLTPELRHYSGGDSKDIPSNEKLDGTRNAEGNTRISDTTPMPPRRGVDGQPSPKRAKGEDETASVDGRGRIAPEMQEKGGGMGILGAVHPNRSG